MAGAMALSYFSLASMDGVLMGVSGGSSSFNSSPGRRRGGVLKELALLTSSSSQDTIGAILGFSEESRLVGVDSCTPKSDAVSI